MIISITTKPEETTLFRITLILVTAVFSIPDSKLKSPLSLAIVVLADILSQILTSQFLPKYSIQLGNLISLLPVTKQLNYFIEMT